MVESVPGQLQSPGIGTNKGVETFPPNQEIVFGKDNLNAYGYFLVARQWGFFSVDGRALLLYNCEIPLNQVNLLINIPVFDYNCTRKGVPLLKDVIITNCNRVLPTVKMDQASGDAANHHNKKGSSNGAASSDSAPTNAAQQAQAAAAAAAALGLIDPSALFAHSLFASGIPASYNPMAPMPGYRMLGQGDPSPFGPSSSSNSDAAAQAAWWNMASQMAAQDYLTRLQHAAVASGGGRSGSTSSTTTTFPGMSGFPGMSATDSLIASYTSAMSAAKYPGSSGNKSSSSRSSKSSSVVFRDSLSNQLTPSTSSGGSGKSRIPDPKFTMPNESSLRKSSSSSSKNRRRAATATSSTEASSSSLSSLSSMAMSYPFFGNPLASLSMPGMAAAAAAASGATSPYASGSNTPEDKKRRKTERHSSGSADPSIQLLRLPGNVNNNTTNNNSSKARSQTVNGKPLALDVSSLIGKPSSSSTSPAAATTTTEGSSSGEAPLNLSMKTTSTPKEESHSTGSSRLGRGVSMPKKNTVASLLAQSRNQRSKSPHNNSTNPPAAQAASSGASSLSSQPSASELKAMSENLALYRGKLSSAYLNGIKDSLTPNNHQGNSVDPNQAIQDLLRAASLLGGFSFGPADSAASGAAKKDGAKESSKSTENGQSNKNGKSSHDDTHSDDSDSMEEDDSMIDSDDGWAGTGMGSDSRKRAADGGDGSDDRPSKRRRFVSDEAAIRVPLTLGWKRETLIRAIGKSGVRGEVTYYSPSGRRFRQYSDVIRSLEWQGIGTITWDNFSFSTRCIVGELIQPLGEFQNSRGIRLDKTEVPDLVDQIRIARGWKPRSRRRTEEEKEAFDCKGESQRAAQRVEAQDLATRQAQEVQFQQRMERERALQEAKEVCRQMRKQENLELQEAMRKERELRNQQTLEARKKRPEELDRLREEEQQRKQSELNKQRELFYTAELERERKRQHTAIVKALEARKRYEDRERKREELRAGKRAEREKKLEERRKELESWKDQRSPIEDLTLLDHKPFPDVPRITHLKLDGKAFAGVLMLYEFLHTFGETLGFDMESLPFLDSLQRYLLFDSEAEEELLSVMTHLLVCAIEDPGIPHPNRHTTLLGQTLKQADITTTNVSEILRIYLQANGLGDMKLPAADKVGANNGHSANNSPSKAAVLGR